MRLSKYTVWAGDPTSLDGYFLISFRDQNQKIISLDSLQLNALQAGNLSVFSATNIKRLQSARILVDKHEDELASVLAENNDENAANETLTRIVMPTANCPHGCNLKKYGAYCGQTHSKHSLERHFLKDYIDETKDILESNKRYRKVRLNFFGGEPLLEPLLVENTIREFAAICKSCGIELACDLTTSGLLLDLEIATALHRVGLNKVQITLDGLAFIHDQRRATKGGNPTFQKIYENLLRIVSSDVLDELQISIRMNVDTRNIQDAAPLFEKLINDGIVPRAYFYVSPVRDFGGFTAGTDFDCRRDLLKLELAIIQKFIQFGYSGHILPNRQKITCEAVDDSSTILDPFGSRHRCTEVPLVKLSKDLPTAFGREKSWAEGWQSMIQGNEVSCSNCRVLPICGGACPKDWALNVPPCPSFKENIAERLVLAALSGERGQPADLRGVH